MQNKFKTIGLAVILLIAFIAIAMSYYKYDKGKSADFATDAANDISTSWQAAELQKRAHPSMIENINKSGHSVEDYFAVLSKLGALKQVMECKLIHSGITDVPQFYVNTDYVCQGEYEKGPATLVIGLVQERIFGPWQIANFHVDSPIFAPPSDKQKQK